MRPASIDRAGADAPMRLPPGDAGVISIPNQ